jgi:hypothetical protein
MNIPEQLEPIGETPAETIKSSEELLKEENVSAEQKLKDLANVLRKKGFSDEEIAGTIGQMINKEIPKRKTRRALASLKRRNDESVFKGITETILEMGAAIPKQEGINKLCRLYYQQDAAQKTKEWQERNKKV